MLKNIFKTAFRNILRERGYSLLNLCGLTAGITCSLFLLIYVLNELSYESQHTNRDRIYRVVSHIKEKDNEFTWTSAQTVLAAELMQHYPEVQQAVRFIHIGRQLFVNDRADVRFYEDKVFAADSSVLTVFTFPMIAGDPATALKAPNTMVLTKKLATKYFGNQDPVGKVLVNGDKSYTITGLMKDLPGNTHLEFDALVSRASLPETLGSWGSWGVPTYLLLPSGYDIRDFDAIFDKINADFVKPIFDQYGISVRYFLQSLDDIHLHSDFEGNGRMAYVYIFASVAVIILLIASINYTNLATARASRRAKEVGVRKAAGSSRSLLVAQFLSESMVLAFLALILSVLLVVLLMPAFNELAGTELARGDVFNVNVLIGLIIMMMLIGIAGGSYPAFYIAGFNPVKVLKSSLSTAGGNIALRRLLVVLQFIVSIAMVIVTWVVYDQLRYLQTTDLGFAKDHIVVIPLADRNLQNNYRPFKNRLLQLPDIIDVTSTSNVPGDGLGKQLMLVETEEGTVERGVDLFWADHDFIPTMGITLVQGRNFSADSPDTLSIIVNEAMVRRMGWENPLGRVFKFTGDQDPEFRVIGVMRDYNQLSLYDEVIPLAILYRTPNFKLAIRIRGDQPGTIQSIETAWKQVNPGSPFNYVFLDEEFDSRYASDELRGRIFTIFAILAVAISLLGLLGLAAYTAEQRTREIGIRKVIGATTSQILLLVGRDYIRMIVIGFILAVPIAYLFIREWLTSFAYRVDLMWWMFVIP